jgi:lysozyme family protein
MSLTIDEVLDMIIRNEGGYVSNPADRGGPTNMGVTQATLSQYLGRQASIQDVKNLTMDQAKEIFARNYVSGPRIDTLPADIVPVLADASVLFGPKRAIMFLQTVLNKSGYGPVDVDGVIGPISRQKVIDAYGDGTPSKTVPGKYLVNAIVHERIAFCQRIVANDPSQGIFLDGWNNRSNRFLVEV